MECYVQIDKESKRVIAYSSSISNTNACLEIKINKEDIRFKELLENPFIFKYDNNTFTKDIEFQNKLIENRKNNLNKNDKFTWLTRELAKNKIELMQKNQMLNMIVKEQAKLRIKKMKVGE